MRVVAGLDVVFFYTLMNRLYTINHDIYCKLFYGAAKYIVLCIFMSI